MPEMPEVEIIRRSLAQYLPGRCIVQIEVLLPRQIKWPDADGFCARLQGRQIQSVERRGKYLCILLEEAGELVVHLRMTGRLVYEAAGEVRDAYARLVFHLDNGAKLVYGDTRTLGAVYALAAGERWRIKGLAEMGPEPLSEEFTSGYLRGIFAKRKTKVKSALLNQSLIGGIGNIYADEALFLAGIHPVRTAGSLSLEETESLHHAVNQVIGAGIADGGTTFRDYQNAEGGKGSHQEKLYVYHRAGEPCRICGSRIQRIVVGGRGTHFCPACQKETV